MRLLRTVVLCIAIGWGAAAYPAPATAAGPAPDTGAAVANTPADYASALKPALARLRAVGNAITSAVDKAQTKTDAQIAEQFAGLARRTRAARDNINTLSPPAPLAAKQRALSRAITRAARDLGQISRAGRIGSPALARRSARGLVKHAAQVRDARRALERAAGIAGA